MCFPSTPGHAAQHGLSPEPYKPTGFPEGRISFKARRRGGRRDFSSLLHCGGRCENVSVRVLGGATAPGRSANGSWHCPVITGSEGERERRRSADRRLR